MNEVTMVISFAGCSGFGMLLIHSKGERLYLDFGTGAGFGVVGGGGAVFGVVTGGWAVDGAFNTSGNAPSRFAAASFFTTTWNDGWASPWLGGGPVMMVMMSSSFWSSSANSPMSRELISGCKYTTKRVHGTLFNIRLRLHGWCTSGMVYCVSPPKCSFHT